MNEDTKICKICNVDQPLENFKVKKAKYGPFRLHQCNKCLAKIAHDNYVSNLRNRTPAVTSISNETWISIFGFEGLYMISDKGRVKSLPRLVKAINAYSYRETNERILRQWQNVQNDYMQVSLKKEGKRINKTIHTIMANAFIPNPLNKPEVNHLNGIRWDNRIENFEWATTSENANHKVNILGYRQPRGEKSKLSKGVIIIYPGGREEFVKGIGEAGRKLGASGGQAISKVIQGKLKWYKGHTFRYADCPTKQELKNKQQDAA